MTALADLVIRPPHATADEHFAAWFARIADRLLNGCDFLVAGTPHRVAEIEAYYHGPDHPDPFPHPDTVQRCAGRWYFHRIGPSYRGGSFKGLDLTLGDGTNRFALLIRSIVRPDGTLVDGPSCTVDDLLKQTGEASVAALDERIAARLAWDESSPLAIRDSEVPRTMPVYRTARVGLSLKRDRERRLQYIDRPYRFLIEPRRIRKGRTQLVLALHQQGHGADAIHALTGTPRRTIARYAGSQAVAFTRPASSAGRMPPPTRP